MNIRKAYSYDDVLLVPKHSSIKSRNDIDTSVELPRGFKLDIPIVSANMKNVTGPEMGHTISQLGGLGLLHRFSSGDRERLNDFCEAVKLRANIDGSGEYLPGRHTLEHIKKIGLSVGINRYERSFLKEISKILLKEWIKIICVDVAHGHHQMTIDMIKSTRELFPESLIIAGNVATSYGAFELAANGADVIKVGCGPGSICSTRIETGNGVPQLTALEDVRRGISDFNNVSIIADGGIKNAGDCVKALVFADAVMIGNLLAGCPEAPGDIITIKGQRYKQYAGSSTHKTRNVEGVIGLVPCTNPAKDVVNKLMEGIRSGMSYQGVENLQKLKDNPEFVEITNAGLVESKPHDVIL
jgi:IMP dehydrogenase